MQHANRFTRTSASLRWQTAFALLFTSLAANAQTASETHDQHQHTSQAELIQLAPMVVTAVQQSSPLPIIADPKDPRQPIPASDATDYLKTIPGFSAIRSGGTNGDTVLRGMFGSRINLLANGLLRLFGIPTDQDSGQALGTAELRTVVTEASALIPARHQRMLLSILDLEEVTVDDVMVPRQEIVGIDLDEPWEDNLALIRDSVYSRLPVFRDDIDEIDGILRIRDIHHALAQGTLTKSVLTEKTREPYYVPEGTPLNTQLANFQRLKQRVALVVDEYGDVQGLVTTEDIVREIVGEFGTDPGPVEPEIHRESDGSFVVDASSNIRQLNRLMNWNLPTDGPKTLNGLIVERLETIPESGTGLTVDRYPIEILDTTEHAIKKVRVSVPASARDSQ